MKTVTVYPSPVCYTHYFQNMDTKRLKAWIEVALRKLPYYGSNDRTCVIRALIQARKELATR